MSTGKKCGKNTTVQNSEPYIKVTRMERGWGIRLYKPNGTLHSEDIAKAKSKIGPVCRYLLRWYAKDLAPYSKYADRARHRARGKGEGINKDVAHDKACRFRDMAWNQKYMCNEKH